MVRGPGTHLQLVLERGPAGAQNGIRKCPIASRILVIGNKMYIGGPRSPAHPSLTCSMSKSRCEVFLQCRANYLLYRHTLTLGALLSRSCLMRCCAHPVDLSQCQSSHARGDCAGRVMRPRRASWSSCAPSWQPSPPHWRSAPNRQTCYMCRGNPCAPEKIQLHRYCWLWSRPELQAEHLHNFWAGLGHTSRGGGGSDSSAWWLGMNPVSTLPLTKSSISRIMQW